MNLGIEHRVAVVTGGSAGIGQAVAQELLENGACVLIAARDAGRLHATEAMLAAQTKGRISSIAVDVGDADAAARIADAAVSRFGSLDILVNNAGRAHAGGLMSATEADWEEMTSVKLTSMRRLCKLAIPIMSKRGWGRIVNMSSIGGIYPNPKLLVSHVLSAAISNLTKSLALEVAGNGILVNAIGIGAVATDNWANNMLPAVRRSRPDLAALSDQDVLAKVSAELTPVGRPGSAREIAAIAAFLASDRNGFVTGDTIEASGGSDRFM